MVKLQITDKDKKDLEKKQWRILGNHGAIEICTWTKKALRGEGVCYKEQFYGAHCHRCAQITPVALWCDQNCVYCWRPMEQMTVRSIGDSDIDDPGLILNDVIPQRSKLLSGLGGNEKVDPEKFREALIPDHYAISLSGEPTMYPKLGEMVRLLRKKPEVRTIFIVTNGQNPDVLEKLWKDDALPTQLYVSLTAPNEALFKELNKSMHPDGWERLNRTLELLPSLPTRRVIRLTLIKGLNDKDEYIREFAKLIEKTGTDFVEVKAYMHIGYSTHRLKRSNMPTHEEVKAFSERLEDALEGYDYSDEAIPSRIVLLKNRSSRYDNMIKPEEK
ncbi:MAG: 4-demethylwyosine synthase TYW1 [Candidatus Micrarchaeota archaeon]|nr:4-demethylwyosine synthase TYW1 [Candidatus Micrarchaeota archaeon]